MRRTDLEYYRELYKTMMIRPEYKGSIEWYVNKARVGMLKYQEASKRAFEALNISVPWQVIACIHLLEGSGDFTRQILNGEIWSKKTKLVPKGLGPWSSWYAACVDAFKQERWNGINFNDIGDILFHIEMYNGAGYAKYHNINSPYLWSFSNHYEKGKYVEDGKYSATAVSKQCGAAVILNQLYFKLEQIENINICPTCKRAL